MKLADSPTAHWTFPTLLPRELPAPAAVKLAPFPGGKVELHIGRIWDEDDPEFARIYAQVGDQVAVERGASLLQAVAAAQQLAITSDLGSQPHAVMQAKSGAYFISPVYSSQYDFSDLRHWRAKPNTDAVVALVDDQRWIDFTSSRS
jgi:hypothetical protein